MNRVGSKLTFGRCPVWPVFKLKGTQKGRRLKVSFEAPRPLTSLGAQSMPASLQPWKSPDQAHRTRGQAWEAPKTMPHNLGPKTAKCSGSARTQERSAGRKRDALAEPQAQTKAAEDRLGKPPWTDPSKRGNIAARSAQAAQKGQKQSRLINIYIYETTFCLYICI